MCGGCAGSAVAFLQRHHQPVNDGIVGGLLTHVAVGRLGVGERHYDIDLVDWFRADAVCDIDFAAVDGDLLAFHRSGVAGNLTDQSGSERAG